MSHRVCVSTEPTSEYSRRAKLWANGVAPVVSGEDVKKPPASLAPANEIPTVTGPEAKGSGTARIDFRLDANQGIFALEANPNPEIAYGEELAESAEKAGLSYEGLLQQIVSLGLHWRHDVYA